MQPVTRNTQLPAFRSVATDSKLSARESVQPEIVYEQMLASWVLARESKLAA
jgi:hypothetical protein